MGRNTNTGAVLENMVLPALSRGGYTFRKQVAVGTRPGGGTHKIDALAEKSGEAYLISMKWQQTAGTAEQKVPFEIICLAEAMKTDSKYRRAYLVLGGTGWTLRNFFITGVQRHLVGTEAVRVVSLEQFVAIANDGKL